VSDEKTPVNTKAFLIDPATMTVTWMNEAAAEAASPAAESGAGDGTGIPIAQAEPLVEPLEALDALGEVAETGEPRHLRANLLKTAQGSLAVGGSIYRLPDGKLLMLIEKAWHAEHKKRDPMASQQRGRRGR
jgi:hypothetical protein